MSLFKFIWLAQSNLVPNTIALPLFILFQKKDLALAPITITAERELIIDFSKPFMDFGMSLIMRKPGEPPINIFAFLLPFTNNLWLSTIVVVRF